MSFILEALRKLEEKRVPATTREILVGRSGGMLARSRGAPRAALLAGILLVSGGTLTAWFLLGGSETMDGGGTTSAVKAPPPPAAAGKAAGGESVRQETPPPPSTATVPETSPVPSHRETAPVVPDAATAETAAVPAEAPQGGATAPPREAEARPTEAPAALSLAAAPEAGGAEAGKLYRIEELPADVRGDLEDFRIAGHVYSDEPSLRLLSVGEGLRREGETLGPGMMLEEITAEGAIFTYRGYRFFLRGY